MANDLRAAALAIKDHAWLERFRKATYDNGHHKISPCAANQIAEYVDAFIDAVLAANPMNIQCGNLYGVVNERQAVVQVRRVEPDILVQYVGWSGNGGYRHLRTAIVSPEELMPLTVDASRLMNAIGASIGVR